MADVAWRRTNAIVGVLSLLALLLVTGLLLGKQTDSRGPLPSTVASVNAVMNGLTVVALTLGYSFIRRGKVAAHRRAMVVALLTSIAFLIGYVIHHASVGSVRFQGTGLLRTCYFALLIPHVVLAAVELPLVLWTIRLALAGRFVEHRRVARITLPVWLFVSASGVAVYFMLYRT